MCGISGLVYLDDVKPSEVVLEKMNDSILHRGPDSGAIHINGNVGLTHRRLSIIDLSDIANQPFSSDDGRYTLVFNGEIYNFQELKAQLVSDGTRFRTKSDTEVVLSLFEKEGMAAFAHLNGMFALAILDNQTGELTLARDPFGIKPLYIYQSDSLIVFASEMKAIRQVPDVSLTISEQALTEYFWYGNPLGNHTFYNEISELDAGCYMRIIKDGIQTERYFDVTTVAACHSSNDVVRKTRDALEQAVKRHLVSDVPVGVFLSGGIDSSAITAFASMNRAEKLATYSVDFDFSKQSSELPLATKVAKQFNTLHHEVKVSGKNVMQAIETLVDMHDEPFGDAADIPLYLLTEKIKGEIKVVLQGDGGDEFFGGYSRYNTISHRKKWNLLRPLMPIIMSLRISNTKWMRFQRFAYAITRKEAWHRHALLLTMESKNTNPLQILNGNWRKKTVKRDPFKVYKEQYNRLPDNIKDIDALFIVDSQIILKDTFFEKVDKSTMANSIEVRVPFVDKELASWCLATDGERKVKDGGQKALLKESLRGIVPDEILDGKKKGFGVPYAEWLKGPLKHDFESHISTEIAKSFIDYDRVHKLFLKHVSGRGNYGFLLWKTFILCIWLNRTAS
ncbi:MAG: asparagine synthase (glutamine-hydrolyzing) [Flavobacteriia bacterium]|nr:asparagine synthase (glutamine-hydrolyzing) [Flavobacteriia bacterium]